MDKPISGRGGYRPGAGRKSKAVELKMIEKLAPFADEALAMLIEKVRDGDKDMLKLFLSYMYGVPKQKIEQDTNISMNGIDFNMISFKSQASDQIDDVDVIDLDDIDSI